MKVHTDITVILDCSGSMSQIKKATINGFNGFVKEFASLNNNTQLTLVQFNHKYELSFQNKNIQDVNPLNDDTYVPSGMTALFDAIGKSIKHKKILFKSTESNRQPKHVIVAIITDGFENSSNEYSRDKISKMINKKVENDNWNFMYLGADQDAILEGSRIGISPDYSHNFEASKTGIRNAFKTVLRQSKVITQQNTSC